MKPVAATTKELAQRYGVHVKTIYRWTYRLVLPVVKVRRNCVRFDPAKCDRAMKWHQPAEGQTDSHALPQGRKLAAAKEIATRYAVRPRTIYKWTRLGILPVVKISRNCIRYDFEKCDQALERRTRSARNSPL